MNGNRGTASGISGRYSLDIGAYRRFYKMSMERPEEFWATWARSSLTWLKEWETVCRQNIDGAKVEWFPGATLNAAYNSLDRHLDTKRDRVAFHIESEDPEHSATVTYGELAHKVADFARVLNGLGVAPNDRVIIHLQDSVELVVAVLACAKLGAVYSVAHSAYGGEALAYRISTCGAKLVITSDGHIHAGKAVPLKPKVDFAISQCPTVERVVFFD